MTDWQDPELERLYQRYLQAGYGPEEARREVERTRRSQDIGRQVGRGLAESGYATGLGIAWLGDKLLPGDQSGWRRGMEQSRDEARAYYGEPETPAGMITQAGARVVGDLAQFAAPGVGLARATRGLKGLSAAKRFALEVGAGVPMDVLQAGGERESSMTGMLADMGPFKDSELLDRLADSPTARALTDAAMGAGLSGAIAALPAAEQFIRMNKRVGLQRPISEIGALGDDVGRVRKIADEAAGLSDEDMLIRADEMEMHGWDESDTLTVEPQTQKWWRVAAADQPKPPKGLRVIAYMDLDHGEVIWGMTSEDAYHALARYWGQDPKAALPKDIPNVISGKAPAKWIKRALEDDGDADTWIWGFIEPDGSITRGGGPMPKDFTATAEPTPKFPTDQLPGESAEDYVRRVHPILAEGRNTLEGIDLKLLGDDELADLLAKARAAEAPDIEIRALKKETERRGVAPPAPEPGGGQVVGSIEPDVPTTTGRVAKRNLKKGAIVSLRDLPPDEALKVAKQGGHLKQDAKTGQYIGAPRGLDAPGKLKRMRAELDRLVKLGVLGRDWYHRARAGVREAAGPDPIRQALMADELATYSAQANPNQNLGFALNAHNAYEMTGESPRVRYDWQADRIGKARATGERVDLGQKTGPYANKLNPAEASSHIPVNDIWHFRAFGYVDPKTGKPWDAGGTPQMHAFVDAETLLIADRANALGVGGFADWTAEEVQAAIWVAKKGEALFKENPKKYKTLQEAMVEAAKSYPDYFQKHVMFSTYEAVPGRNTGQLEGVEGAFADAPAAERAAYSADPRSSWADEEGRDVLWDAAGYYQLPTLPATGYYRAPGGALETNPAQVGRPLVGLQDETVHPRDLAAAKAVESVRAYLDAQNMGAASRVGITPSGGTALFAPLDRKLTPAEIDQLEKLLQPYGMVPVDTGQGLEILNFGDAVPDNTALGKLLRGTKDEPGLVTRLKDILPDMKDIRRGPQDAVATMVDDTFGPLMDVSRAGTGEATRELERVLSDPAIPRMLDRLDDVVRQRALDRFTRDADIARQTGRATREDIDRARQIVASEGLRGLFKALREGAVLPVLALGALGVATESGA